GRPGSNGLEDSGGSADRGQVEARQELNRPPGGVAQERVAIEDAVESDPGTKIAVEQAVEPRPAHVDASFERVPRHRLRERVGELERVVGSLLREVENVDADRTERGDLELADRSGSTRLEGSVPVAIDFGPGAVEHERAPRKLAERELRPAERETQLIRGRGA